MLEHYNTKMNILSKRYTTSSKAFVSLLPLTCRIGFCYIILAVWMTGKTKMSYFHRFIRSVISRTIKSSMCRNFRMTSFRNPFSLPSVWRLRRLVNIFLTNLRNERCGRTTGVFGFVVYGFFIYAQDKRWRQSPCDYYVSSEFWTSKKVRCVDALFLPR